MWDNLPNFMRISSGSQVILKDITSTICAAAVLVLMMREIVDYTSEMASCSMTYKPSVMKSSTDVQAALRSCLNSLGGCNAGITKRRDLLNILLRWLHMV
jgi:hypothetical protein